MSGDVNGSLPPLFATERQPSVEYFDVVRSERDALRRQRDALRDALASAHEERNALKEQLEDATSLAERRHQVIEVFQAFTRDATDIVYPDSAAEPPTFGQVLDRIRSAVAASKEPKPSPVMTEEEVQKLRTRAVSADVKAFALMEALKKTTAAIDHLAEAVTEEPCL